MAKSKTAAAKSAAAPKKKVGKSAKGKSKAVSAKSKKDPGTSSRATPVDALLKLADHPLVGELITIGATAAVAAIAQQGLSDSKKKGSAKAVKEAGKAAAAAIGARLISEFAESKSERKSKPAKA